MIPSSCSSRGATRSSRTSGQDAMDVKVFNAGQPRVDEETFADGQAVWSRHPDAGVKFCGTTMSALTGPTRRAERWWLTSPVRQGERGAAVKTIVQGMPVDPAQPVVTAACFFCCRRAMGEAITRHSLRPLSIEGRCLEQTRADRAAGTRCRVFRHCGEFVKWAKRSVPTISIDCDQWWARRMRAFAHPTDERRWSHEFT